MTEDISRRIKYFSRADPSHVIERKTAWGTTDGFGFAPPAEHASLHFRCLACNGLQTNDFLDMMVCSACGWQIPSLALARDIYIEAHNISIGFGGGWTAASYDVACRSTLPVTINPQTMHSKPVGDVARNMTAWHIEALEAGIRQARIKAEVISRLRAQSSIDARAAEHANWS